MSAYLLFSRLFVTPWTPGVTRALKNLLQHHNLKSSILQNLAFFYGPALTSIRNYWKNCSFGYMDLCWQSGVGTLGPWIKVNRTWSGQETATVSIDVLGIRELKWMGMGKCDSDDRCIYYCGQESLRRNETALKRVRNAVPESNFKWSQFASKANHSASQ